MADRATDPYLNRPIPPASPEAQEVIRNIRKEYETRIYGAPSPAPAPAQAAPQPVDVAPVATPAAPPAPATTPDHGKIKRNIKRMMEQNAPVEDIDGYIASEGVTLNQLKGQQPQSNLSPEEANKKAMYEGRAKYMREQHPTITAIRDTAQRLVEGTPVGSWFDEGMAKLSSSLPEEYGGSGLSYDDAKGVLDADRRIRDNESTVVGKLPVVGDVTVGGLTKLAGGIASAPLAPAVRVMGGTTLAPRMVNSFATGLGWGAVAGSGEGNTVSERAGNAAIGSAIGGSIGAAAPPIARGLANVGHYIADRATALPQGIVNYSRGAVNRIQETLGMDGMTPDAANQRAQALGPEAMLADTGENMRTVTEGLAQQPGPARQTIQGALNGRANTARDRIATTLDAEMGAPTNVQATIDHMRTNANQQADPHYTQFHQTPVPASPALEAIVDRARRAQPGLFNSAMRLAVADGVDPVFLRNLVNDPMTALTGVQRNVQGNRVWQGVELDYLKRALDDVARGAGRGTNENRIFSNMARDLRNTVDNAVSPGNPAQSPWAQARAIVSEERGVSEALEDGYGVFRNGGRDPVQVQNDLTGLSALERDAYQLGARSELRDVMGRAATNFRANGDRAVRRALNSDFNRLNLNTILGPQGGQRVVNRINAENTFADTADQVMGNSATARRQATRSIIPRQYEGAVGPELRGSSWTGLIAHGLHWAANRLTMGALNERNARIARDMAEMLIAQGARRDAIAAALMQQAQRAQGNLQARDAMARIAEDVMRGTTAPSINAARR